MTGAFATPAELDTFTGRTIPAAQATMMLAQASALIRSFCGWHLYPPAEDTLTVDGSGSMTLCLPSLHVTAVDSVDEEDIALTVDTDYQWSTSGMLRRVGTSWTDELQGVLVVFTHGYADPPLEVQAVCLQAATRAIASPSGVKSEQSGGVSVVYAVPGGLTEYEQLVLERHRVPQAP